MSDGPGRPLGELATYVNGRAFKPDEWVSSGLPIIRIQNLTEASAPFNYFAGEIEDRHRVRDGDLLVSWSASLDAFIWRRGEAVLNQHIFRVLERTDLVDRTYLYFAIREAMSEIRAQVHGATMRHITKPEFEAVRVPVPKLDEQRRVAAMLTEQLAVVERARQAAEERVEAAQRLLTATLRRFGARLSGVPCRELREVADLLPSVSVSSDGGAVIQCVTTACLSELGFRKEGVKTSKMRPEDVGPATLTSGEILVARSNTSELVGRATMYDGSVPGVVCSDLTIRLRSREFIRAEFLAGVLSFLFVDGFWRDRAGGASGSMKKITRSQLAALLVPMPSLREQDVACAELRSWRRQADALVGMVNAELAAIEALPAALLREAFESGR